MSANPRRLSPTEWADPTEREYAELQAAYADVYDVDPDSWVIETDAAGDVHYLRGGDPDGDPVLLLHGVSTHAATWMPMLPALQDFDVIVPDRPGRGLSEPVGYGGHDLRSFMVAYLTDLLDELDIDSPHVVGNSLGGQQAFLLAIDHDRVDRLCLIGGPGGISRDFDLLWKLQTVRGLNRVLFWLLTRGDPIETARTNAEQFLVDDTSAIHEEFYELLAVGQRLPGRMRSLRSLTTQQGSFLRMHPIFDLRDEIVDIDRPTAYVWGTEDSFWPPSVGRPVAEQMPDAEFHVLDDHGHMPFLEPGDRTQSVVRTFLSTD